MPAQSDQSLHQVVQHRKTAFPERPLIRISSTFFWHMSSDYDLAPIPSLAARAKALRADTINLGKVDLDEEAIYEPMKVGQQVQKYALSQSPHFIDDADHYLTASFDTSHCSHELECPLIMFSVFNLHRGSILNEVLCDLWDVGLNHVYSIATMLSVYQCNDV